MNRVIKLKDKLSPEVGNYLNKVIQNFNRICKELDPVEFIKTSNLTLLE